MLPYDESQDKRLGRDNRAGQVPDSVRRTRVVVIIQLALVLLNAIVFSAVSASHKAGTRTTKVSSGTAGLAVLSLLSLVSLIILIVAAVNLTKMRSSTRTATLLAEGYLVLAGLVGLALSKGNPVAVVLDLISPAMAAFVLYQLTRPATKVLFKPRVP